MDNYTQPSGWCGGPDGGTSYQDWLESQQKSVLLPSFEALLVKLDCEGDLKQDDRFQQIIKLIDNLGYQLSNQN